MCDAQLPTMINTSTLYSNAHINVEFLHFFLKSHFVLRLFFPPLSFPIFWMWSYVVYADFKLTMQLRMTISFRISNIKILGMKHHTELFVECNAGDGIPSVVQARQALCPLSCIPSPQEHFLRTSQTCEHIERTQFVSLTTLELNLEGQQSVVSEISHCGRGVKESETIIMVWRVQNMWLGHHICDDSTPW